ncbi:peptidoglycan-binding domain-containing protein, partial [Oharaeibacter diazotrophicus]
MPRRDLDLEPPPRSIARSAAGVLFANPTSTAGGLVMTAMAIAIMTNALALQSGPHPAPLFLGTRPVAAAAEPAAEPREPFNLRDRAMVADIQLALKARGYYGGDVDGLPGPMTSTAIAAYE